MATVRDGRRQASDRSFADRQLLLLVREDQIDLPPVLLRGGALRRPVRRVIQLIGHLRRPEAAHVAVEQIALDRLTQSGRAAVAIRFPAGRRRPASSRSGCAAARAAAAVRPAAAPRRRLWCLFHARGFTDSNTTRPLRACIRLSDWLHDDCSPEPRSSSNCRRNAGFLHRDLAVDLQTRVRPAANPLAVVQVRRRRSIRSACCAS